MWPATNSPVGSNFIKLSAYVVWIVNFVFNILHGGNKCRILIASLRLYSSRGFLDNVAKPTSA